MSESFLPLGPRIRFDPDHAVKVDLFRGTQLLAGLNCFEPGQHQSIHTHGGTDKFYFVVSGRARLTVGTQTREVEAGAIVWAPADLPHGVDEALERTVMLVAMAPPPGLGA